MHHYFIENMSIKIIENVCTYLCNIIIDIFIYVNIM